MKRLVHVLVVLMLSAVPASAWEAEGFASGMSEKEVVAEATVRSIELIKDISSGSFSRLRTPISGSHETDYHFDFCNNRLRTMKVFRIDSDLKNYARIVDTEINRLGRPLFDARVEYGSAVLTSSFQLPDGGSLRIRLQESMVEAGTPSVSREYIDPDFADC